MSTLCWNWPNKGTFRGLCWQHKVQVLRMHKALILCELSPPQEQLLWTSERFVFLVAKLMCKRNSQRWGISLREAIDCVLSGASFSLGPDKALEKESSLSSNSCVDIGAKPTQWIRPAVLADVLGRLQRSGTNWEHHQQKPLPRKFVSSKYFQHRRSVC